MKKLTKKQSDFLLKLLEKEKAHEQKLSKMESDWAMESARRKDERMENYHWRQCQIHNRRVGLLNDTITRLCLKP